MVLDETDAGGLLGDNTRKPQNDEPMPTLNWIGKDAVVKHH
jgi:hypothetical protein